MIVYGILTSDFRKVYPHTNTLRSDLYVATEPKVHMMRTVYETFEQARDIVTDDLNDMLVIFSNEGKIVKRVDNEITCDGHVIYKAEVEALHVCLEINDDAPY